MYLKNITIKEDFRNLKKGHKIELLTLTLLVGEQGCGKSSLLSLIQDNNIDFTPLPLLQNKEINTYFFDSEKMNPRILDLDDFVNPDGTNKGIGVSGSVLSHFKSHGEILREYTVNSIKKAKNCILILDEPESALSLKNQYKLANELKKAEKNNVQTIIATHCLPLIESVEKVYSLQTNEWISSKEFIENSKNY